MTQKLTILFDLDGTLVDTAPDLMGAHNYVMKKFGYSSKSVEDIRNLVGKGASVLIGRSIWGSAKKEFSKVTDDKIKKEKVEESYGSNKGKLVPSEVGKLVNEFLCNNFEDIIDYNFTADVENNFDLIASGKKQWKEIINEFFRLHKISSSEKKTFMTTKMEKFFTDLIIKMLSEDSLLYSYLKIENKTVACSISFRYANVRFLYNSGFDPSYNNFSSGLLNHAFAIKRSIENKIEVFDFMRGNERYKYDLGAVDKMLYTFQIEKNV